MFMAAEPYYFQDLCVQKRIGRAQLKHAVVFFHGFPGGGTRGLDLGDALHTHAGVTTFVVQYGGLGQGRGAFSFLNSVEMSLAFVKSIQESDEFEKISLYGASWGGLVALNAASRLGNQLGSLMLASPFSLLPTPDYAKQLLKELQTEEGYPQSLTTEAALTDLQVIAQHYNPRTTVGEIVAKDGVLLMQARVDTQVPAMVNETLRPLFKTALDYRLVEQDHSFSNRDALIQTLIEWITSRD